MLRKRITQPFGSLRSASFRNVTDKTVNDKRQPFCMQNANKGCCFFSCACQRQMNLRIGFKKPGAANTATLIRHPLNIRPQQEKPRYDKQNGK